LRNNEGRIKNILKKIYHYYNYSYYSDHSALFQICFNFFSQILEIRYYPMVTIPKITVTKLSPTIVEPILLLH